MKGLYKAVTEAAKRYDKLNRAYTEVRIETISFIYELPRDDVREMVYDAIEVRKELLNPLNEVTNV